MSFNITQMMPYLFIYFFCLFFFLLHQQLKVPSQNQERLPKIISESPL